MIEDDYFGSKNIEFDRWIISNFSILPDNKFELAEMAWNNSRNGCVKLPFKEDLSSDYVSADVVLVFSNSNKIVLDERIIAEKISLPSMGGYDNE